MGKFVIETEDGGKYVVETESEAPSGEAVTSPSEAPSLWSESKAVLGKLGRGVADLAGVAMEVNPFQPGGPSLWGYNPIAATSLLSNQISKRTGRPVDLSPSTQLNAAVDKYAPDMGQPQTTPGIIAGEVARAAPVVAIPGIGGVAAIPSVVASGLGSGIVKVAGGDETSQAVGGLVGAVTPAGVRKAATAMKGTADFFERWALGADQNTLRKSFKGMSPAAKAEAVAAGEVPEYQALQGAKERGMLKGAKDSASLNKRNEDAIDTLTNKADEIISSVDKDPVGIAEVKFQPGSLDTILSKKNATSVVNGLDLENTFSFLKKPDAGPAVREAAEKVLIDFYSRWSGKLTGPNGLQEWKSAIAKLGWGKENPQALNTFFKTLANDLKTNIEKQVARRGGDAAKLKELNRQAGEHISLRGMLFNAFKQEEQSNALASAVKSASAGPKAGAVATAASLMTGNPLFAGLWALAAGMGTKTGRFATSGALNAGSKVLAPLGSPNMTGLLPQAARLAPDNQALEAPVYPQLAAQIPKTPEELALAEVLPPPEDSVPTSVSDAGLELIKKKEGLRLKSYKDAVGKTTIGYGHTSTAKPGQTISEEEADTLLRQDVAEAERAVNDLVKVPLSQSQFDALVSFVYNLGRGALAKSTLLAKLNAGETNLTDEFLKYTKAGGKTLPGLLARRQEEASLFGQG